MSCASLTASCASRRLSARGASASFPTTRPISRPTCGYHEYVEAAAERLAQLADHAAPVPIHCCLKMRRKSSVTPSSAARRFCGLAESALLNVSFVWDPANFVQVGESRVTERGPSLGDHVGYVHIKDAGAWRMGRCTPPGGDGQVPELLTILRETGYQGFLALEPHLAVAGHSNGFSGPEGMAYAVQSLCRDGSDRLRRGQWIALHHLDDAGGHIPVVLNE